MKPVRSLNRFLNRLRAAGVHSALLATIALLGSACIAAPDDDTTDEEVVETGEADNMLHSATQDPGALTDPTADEADAVDEVDDWSGDLDGQQGIVIPGTLVSEPEPDPWDDPMTSGHDASNGAGSKD